MTGPVRLGVNVDHVATVRNARGGRHPDPLRAAELAIAAGADGITAHLREDRRHIRDDDIARLMARLSQAAQLRDGGDRRDDRDRAQARARMPPASCRSGAQERTTEGGLDVVGGHNQIAPVVNALRRAGIRVSLFIAADPAQIEAAAGDRRAGDRDPHRRLVRRAWSAATRRPPRRSSPASRAGAARAARLGLEVHAGHGLDYVTAEAVCGAAGDRRAQHRPLHRRRGDLRRARARDQADARRDDARPHAGRGRRRRRRGPDEPDP